MDDDDGEIRTGSDSPTLDDAPFLVNPVTLNLAVADLVNDLMDEMVVAQGTQFGRDFRYGELEELGMLESVGDNFKVNTTPGLDIFGQQITKNAKTNLECECPKCNRTLAAARFAQHLEKCMGMGRNSSRVARRRLAASSASAGASGGNGHGGPTTGSLDVKNPSHSSGAATSNSGNGDLDLGSEEEHFSEDDDEEWTMERKKKTKKPASKKAAVNSDGQ